MPRHFWSSLTWAVALFLAPTATRGFAWETIEPSSSLEYHDCYSEFKCARLSVPLDWLDPENPHKVDIAIIKLPATVPDNDPTFGGSVVMNPGGPGGSGVTLALELGKQAQAILAGNKNYEIVSFDPRGVNFTTPRANCYPDPLMEAANIYLTTGIGPLEPGEDTRIKWRMALSSAYAKRCAETMDHEGGIIRYASTASVARDMVEIIDKIEELREKESEAKHPRNCKRDTGKKQPARLQYIGFSYGTILGNTFASMFPGRVGRMVLDGVANANDYVAGTWLTNLQDADEIIDYFYEFCFELGTKCPLLADTDTSWEDIKKRVGDAIANLRESPVSFNANSGPVLLRDFDVYSIIRSALYQPKLIFPSIYELLSVLLQGNYDAFGPVWESIYPRLEDSCPGNNLPQSPTDALAVISCSDGEDKTKFGVDYWADYVSQLRNQSELLASPWAEASFLCSGWEVRPKYRYSGPFKTPEPDSAIVEGKPAAPLLFVSSRLDPVTPLRNAFAMAAGHPGASVLIQESIGHSALTTARSICTESFVRDYLEHGTVPESGTVCVPECGALEICEEGEASVVPTARRLSMGRAPFYGMF